MNRIVWDYLDRKAGDMRRNDYEERPHREPYEHEGERVRSVRDYEDSRTSRRDYGESHKHRPELTKSDIYDWKHAMKNADGSRGAHFDMQQVIQVADKVGVTFKEYDEKEFCITVNMLYSDYCAVFSKYVPHDKLLALCVESAKAFLEDEDAPEGSVKLALYYHCIVCSEEV